MANGEVYGGQAWIQQQIQAAVQAAMQQINWSQLMGYGFPGMYEPQAPTRADALLSIWENRSDIQAFYYQNWGDPASPKYADRKNWRPEDAIEDWLGITSELDVTGRPPLKGDETPEEIAALEAEWADKKMDPLDWAIQQGYVTDYTAGGAQPTLAREEFEQRREEWATTQLRLAGLDEEAIRQFNETMRYNWDLLDEDVRQSDREYLRQIGLDEESLRRWDIEQARLEGLDAEQVRQANREFLRLEGLDAEGIRQFNAEHDLAKWQAQQDKANIEWEQLRLTGLDEEAAYQFQQTHELAEREFEAGNEQWRSAFGLEEQYYGLDVMKYLASLTGPQDWPQYWAASRAYPEAWGPEGEPIPAWAQALQGDQPFPAFGAPGQVPQEIWGGITPWQVSPEQWARMTPGEIQGLAGQVQTGGGWMPDWMKGMQAGWPQGSATPISYFGT